MSSQLSIVLLGDEIPEPFSSAIRVPPLLQLCQRVAASHIDAISGLEGISYDLARPILECCSAVQLDRIEQATPGLQQHNEELWQRHCRLKRHSIFTADILMEDAEPESWRNHYYALCDAEARRVDEIGNKLRNERLKAEELKKEVGVKITDRLPTAKRPKWGYQQTSAQSKSLFQKTRTEASRVSKESYRVRNNPRLTRLIPNAAGARTPLLPRLPSGSVSSSSSVTTVASAVFPVVSSTPSTRAPTASPSVIVSRRPAPTLSKTSPSLPTVFHKPVGSLPRPSLSTTFKSYSSASSLSSCTSAFDSATAPSSTLGTSRSQPVSTSSGPSQVPAIKSLGTSSTSVSCPSRPVARLDAGLRLPPPPRASPIKSDKTSVLFLPKHRAYSQLGTTARSARPK